MPATDGAGVKLNRIIGTPQMDMIDPFLMLDEFGSDDPESWIAGFPDHPHRGFETVTVMLDGRVRHADSVGNKGVIEAGDVQWMTAGRGIIHSEMPERAEGRLRGFQLWVNLPGSLKLTPPRYQDIPKTRMAETSEAGVKVRVIAGEAFGVRGPAETLIPVRLMEIELAPSAQLRLPVPEGHASFGYVFHGAISTQNSSGDRASVNKGTLAVFEGTGELQLDAGTDGARLLLCDGKPIGEPVARYGPFVMNTRDEIMQAFKDYERGTLAA
jgi:redox-sensitive bicupin YhaK (pirin superfamily)